MTVRYSLVAAWLHWLIAALVIANIGMAIGSEDMARESRRAIMGVHKAFGILILLLTLVRIGWRVGHASPPLSAAVPLWQRRASTAVHYLFYALLLLLPLSGWLWMSAVGAPIDMFGLFAMPPLGSTDNKPLADIMHEAHEIMGKMMVALVLLHFLAALEHQFIDRDNLLSRMRLWH